MEKEPLFIAFASQKGGVGKTAFTVLTAGILHYQRGIQCGRGGLRCPPSTASPR